MPNKVVKPFLTEHQQLKFQRRLSHYFNDYEYMNKIQAKDVAEKIDISPQKFSYIKSDKVPYPRFINCLDYLAKLGNLKQMSVSEFVQYLEGYEKSNDKDTEVKTSDWNSTVIDAFEPITSKARVKFLDLCRKSLRDGKAKMEVLIEIVNLLQDKDIKVIVSLRDALRGMSSTVE